MSYKIEYQEWEHLVPNEVGRQTHFNHDNCPAGKDTKARLYVKRVAGGALAFCHHCGGHGYHYDTKSLIHARYLQQQLENKPLNMVEIPIDIENIFKQSESLYLAPARALEWLSRSDITFECLEKDYGIRHAAGRLLIPSGNGDVVQSRGFDDENSPRYRTYKRNKTSIALWQNKHAIKIYDCWLVEDMLSAIKVRKSTADDAIALLGTNCDDSVIEHLMNTSYKRVFVALDPDRAGREKQHKLVERLKLILVGKRVLSVELDQDPKHTSADDLERISIR